MVKSLKTEGILDTHDTIYLGGVLTVLYDNDKKEGLQDFLLKIRRALLIHNSNVTDAAEELKMHRPDLWFIIEDNPAMFADLIPVIDEGSTVYVDQLAKAERGIILNALALSSNSVSTAAKVLGMKRTTLLAKCRRLLISTVSENHDSHSDRRGNGSN